MYEPKYRLNKRDAQRWYELLTRYCLDCPPKPGHKRRFIRKYPPLTPEENVEFERLSRKRDRKIQSHPAVAASIRSARRRMLKIEKQMAELSKLLKFKVDAARSSAYNKNT